jgi:hypothetical protein
MILSIPHGVVPGKKLSQGTTEAFLAVPGGAIFWLDENGSK